VTGVPAYQWQPSTAEIARRAGIGPAEVIRFDHNTSPFSPPWLAEETARLAAAGLNEYPSADYRPLREAIAGYQEVDPEMVVPGAGADEMITLCAAAFLAPGDRATTDTPAYTMYRIATSRRGADLLEVPRTAPAFDFPTEAMAAAASRARLTWLCIPHNPIGDRPPTARLRRVLDAAAGTVVIDAAYGEFAADRWAAEIRHRPNLIVLGTFSKAFGLAGIRVGYALAQPDLAARLETARPPGSISTVSAALAERASRDVAWIQDNTRRIIAARTDLAERLRGLGVEPLPSASNALLCRVGVEAGKVATALMTEGLAVRAFPADGPLSEHLRFTARTGDAHRRLAAALERSLP